MVATYEFSYIYGSLAQPALLAELAQLYSRHYGRWSQTAPQRPGQNVKLNEDRLRQWLKKDSRISLAKLNGQVVGYAISVQTKYGKRGLISWVTQLVIHEEHRKRDVAKRLLFSIWGMSDHFAWGLLTANPYAIRALEKATKRRCDAKRIGRNADKLKAIGKKQTTYVMDDTVVRVNGSTAAINTKFFLDHSELPEMLNNVQRSAPWRLGPLLEGWEWLAFTFHDHPEIELSHYEIEQMIRASDQVTKQAYSRMNVDNQHFWARHTNVEVPQIVEWCLLAEGQTVLDVGCGTGRHASALAELGLNVTAVDYNATLRVSGLETKVRSFEFIEADARNLDLGKTFDAVICLYDVIGSYANDDENLSILRASALHLRPGARLLLSVMNFELTQHEGKMFFSLEKDSKPLSDLPPSKTMEATGNVFKPEFYLIDADTKVVYRKEQFVEGDHLPAELIVRDRRYYRAEIEDLCRSVGLAVEWSRFVQAGHWDTELDALDRRAKEILVLCRKPEAT
jgi:2-polyprenyl-3-methyl-5-hydroxy-6-metoxy-1,4-benzoquinol methylase